MNYEEQERARLLNEAHEILFSSRHKLGWNNFYTPDISSLVAVRGELDQVVSKLTAVIDGKLFPDMPKLISPKPPIPPEGLR